MRAIIRPSLAPAMQIDVTHALTSVIAFELSRVQQGNEVVNWLEAERILQSLLSGGPGMAAESEPKPARTEHARREEPRQRRTVGRERPMMALDLEESGPPYRG